MGNKKLILFLKLGALGPIVAWAIFLSSNGGFPTGIADSIIFSIAMTASSFVIAMILVSPFLYTKKERKIDKLLGESSSVDEATTDLLIAIGRELDPTSYLKPKHSVTISEQILRDEIAKAKEAGASNEMIAGYLQRELESWTGGSLRARSDFEAYTQLIERLSQ
jgi:hypothetical protein